MSFGLAPCTKFPPGDILSYETPQKSHALRPKFLPTQLHSQEPGTLVEPRFATKMQTGDTLMSKRVQNAVNEISSSASRVVRIAGPSIYEAEYLNQVVEELKIFLKSKNVTTVNDIYLGFQGHDYRGQLLLSKGA